MTYSWWVKGKISTAQALADGCCGATYAEGAIILCAAISAMAAAWAPGADNGIDRKRFIEAIITFRTSKVDPTMISVPLFAEKLEALRERLRVSKKSLRLTGTQDKCEGDVLTLCAGLGILARDVRAYSYAALLYKQVRCNFVHEYRIGDDAAEDDPLKNGFRANDCRISYVNCSLDALNITTKRRIHFPIEWISGVASNVAGRLDLECRKQNKQIFEHLGRRGGRWWIEGA